MTFVPPVTELNHGSATLWGNLGDWSDATEYGDAARALALRLGEAAGLGPGQRLVDLGSGAGDQLRLWVDTFQVAHVTGVERAPELGGRALTRVAAWGMTRRIRVIVGDATRDPWTNDAVDCVLALDSAYFFGPRDTLLRRCRAALRPGGVIAFADIILGDGGAAGVARGVAPLFGVPRVGLLTEASHRARLAEAGFRKVRVQDCTEDVLGGFAGFVRRKRARIVGDLLSRAGLAITGVAAGLLAGRAGLRYVVTTARRDDA